MLNEREPDRTTAVSLLLAFERRSAGKTPVKLAQKHREASMAGRTLGNLWGGMHMAHILDGNDSYGID